MEDRRPYKIHYRFENFEGTFTAEYETEDAARRLLDSLNESISAEVLWTVGL